MWRQVFYIRVLRNTTLGCVDKAGLSLCCQLIAITPRRAFLLREIQPVPISLRALAGADLAGVERIEVIRRAVIGADATRCRAAHQNALGILPPGVHQAGPCRQPRLVVPQPHLAALSPLLRKPLPQRGCALRVGVGPGRGACGEWVVVRHEAARPVECVAAAAHCAIAGAGEAPGGAAPISPFIGCGGAIVACSSLSRAAWSCSAGWMSSCCSMSWTICRTINWRLSGSIPPTALSRSVSAL